jgi:hypothetical protein
MNLRTEQQSLPNPNDTEKTGKNEQSLRDLWITNRRHKLFFHQRPRRKERKGIKQYLKKGGLSC